MSEIIQKSPAYLEGEAAFLEEKHIIHLVLFQKNKHKIGTPEYDEFNIGYASAYNEHFRKEAKFDDFERELIDLCKKYGIVMFGETTVLSNGFEQDIEVIKEDLI